MRSYPPAATIRDTQLTQGIRFCIHVLLATLHSSLVPQIARTTLARLALVGLLGIIAGLELDSSLLEYIGLSARLNCWIALVLLLGLSRWIYWI